MPICGKPDFNWDDNFTVHSTKKEGKAAFMRSWLDDRGAEIIDCYDWTDEEWEITSYC